MAKIGIYALDLGPGPAIFEPFPVGTLDVETIGDKHELVNAIFSSLVVTKDRTGAYAVAYDRPVSIPLQRAVYLLEESGYSANITLGVPCDGEQNILGPVSGGIEGALSAAAKSALLNVDDE